MKAKQISKHIWSLKTRVLIPIHVWLVVDEGGVTLVDTGMPFMAANIIKFIKNLRAGPLQRIVLTHGHSDHVGGVRKIVSMYPVPVFAHRLEIPYMEGKLAYPSRKKSC